MTTSKKIREISPAVVATAELVEYIKLEDLLPNPYQPETRIEVNPETAKKFAYSIQEHGLIQTPVVRKSKDNGKYEVGDGWLRRAGFLFNYKEFGLQDFAKMPCQVKDLTDQQMADMVMEANTVRQDLNPIELAKLYKRYLEDFKIPQIELARKHNCSQGEIANTIRLLELPEAIQQKVISQEISETHGRQLLRLNPMPELQKEMLDRTVKQNYTINELDQAITRSLWDNTRSLKPNDYGFDVKTCDSCLKRIMAVDPWGDQKKQYRCPDTECWDRKQDEAEAARAAKIQGKTEESTGVKKILTGKDLSYNQYQRLDSYATKGIDDPGQCKSCDKTALYKYRADDPGKPELVCLNPNCFRRKKAMKTREVHKIEKQQDHELTAKLGETFRALTDHKAIAVVLARYLLRYPKLNMDGEADMLAYFPELPADKKHRLDDAAVKKWLSDRPLDDLLRICAAAVITHSRRQSAGFHSTKLDGDAKENYAILTAPSKQEKVTQETATVAGIAPNSRGAELIHAIHTNKADLGEQELLSFQFKYCDGCHWADQEKVGTGHPCCTFITTPHIVDGECRTWKAKESKSDSTSDNASDGKDPLAGLVIHIAHDGVQEHIIKKGDIFIRCRNLKAGILNLTEQLGWSADEDKAIKSLNELPASSNRDLLISILEGKQPAEVVQK